MKDNLEDLVEEVLSKLLNFGGSNQSLYGTLTTAITASATTLKVSGPAYPEGLPFSPGRWEIGTEIVQVQSFDKQTGNATGVLRGTEGTTAVAHPAGSGIVVGPKFARNEVARAINDAIAGLANDIKTVKTVEFYGQGYKKTYELPAATRDVLGVQVLDTRGNWNATTKWSFDNTGGSTSVTKKTISINDATTTRKVQVIIDSEPEDLNYGNSLSEDAGIPRYARELVVVAACANLASYMDVSKIATTSFSQATQNQIVPVGSANTIAKFFMARYQMLLEKAVSRQSKDFPATVSWNR